MQPPYRNDTGISLSVAVFLAMDHYDYDETTISATGLIKPIRQIILTDRVPDHEKVIDIAGLIKSRMGTAIHDGIERAWLEGNYQQAMKALGYPQKIIDRIVINPEGELPDGALPVYMEQRIQREFMGYQISGKFDFVADGRLEDFKTTSTFVYQNQSKVEDYQLQGSIYRWLNPEIITKDHMAIQYIFTDFMPAKAAMANYPDKPIQQQLIPLLSLAETEAWIAAKLNQVERHKDMPEPELPFCSDKDLWRKPAHYKYYANPEKMTRSTKNFDDHAEAMAYQAKKHGKGIIVRKPGEVVACKYCPAFSVCTQKDQYIADGSLKA